MYMLRVTVPVMITDIMVMDRILRLQPQLKISLLPQANTKEVSEFYLASPAIHPGTEELMEQWHRQPLQAKHTAGLALKESIMNQKWIQKTALCNTSTLLTLVTLMIS